MLRCLKCAELSIKHPLRLMLPPFGSPQLPSEYEANPELLFYRITHLNHRQQYLIWAAAVTTAGRGNFSDKVTVEPAAKGESPIKGKYTMREHPERLDTQDAFAGRLGVYVKPVQNLVEN